MLRGIILRRSFSSSPIPKIIHGQKKPKPTPQEQPYTRTKRNNNRPVWKAPELGMPAQQEHTALLEIPKATRALLGHLTELHPDEYSRVYAGPSGQMRLELFAKLHMALQNTANPEAIWEAYQDIRQDQSNFEFLSPDIFRLLVIHFKDASPTFPQKESAIRKLWAARIVTVLDDKRSMNTDFSRWDYSDLMSALNRQERYEESIQEFDKFVAARQKVDPILVNHAVRAWSGQGRLDKAAEVIQDARTRHNAKASEHTLGYIIQQYLLAGQRTEAIKFWKKLTENGVLGNLDVANGILRACVRVQESGFAQTVYDSMPRLGIKPNVDSLNFMLALAVSKIQVSEERTQFLEAIDEKITKNNKPVYNKNILDSILVGFSKKGDTESAILVHELMRRHGFLQGAMEHNVILHCLARKRQMDRAINWFCRMRRTGIRPDRVSYTLLIQSYTIQRMPREAEALFRQMLQDGIEPDLATCNFLLLAYEQGRMNRKCLQLYKDMFRDRSIGLDHFSFSCMFNAVFHDDKANLEGGEGLKGRGSSMDNTKFVLKIGEPIGRPVNYSEQTSITSDNESSRIVDTSSGLNPGHSPAVYPAVRQHQYQFEQAVSNTTTLDHRSLFRDMIIVGIPPTRSLYSNILRAFLAQNDFAGAAVVVRTMVDYYVLKPTPKMNAIAATWVCRELDRRGIYTKVSAVNKGELPKLISMMGRTRGLIDMLKKVATIEQWGDDSSKGAVASNPVMSQSVKGTKVREERIAEDLNAGKDLPEVQSKDRIAQAKMEMGGDIVDLYSQSVMGGSLWDTSMNSPVQIDLDDFERWFRVYSNRTTHAQAIKSEQQKP
ncbi:hypothetical protein BG011_005060 [Mortierella polycephala]|uniref:Pentatricopeptide repeat-containing protein n=1 Tax=Mortierella polycephala TaxID=41804 RepID=A0A9P6PZ71_9FUNG|nr:hypothetical protein BG011_005060 [Mortierella polycephala]